MSSGLRTLYQPTVIKLYEEDDNTDRGVDIVAVHGVGEDSIIAWTDLDTRTLWLKDLLPESLPFARVLTFGYQSEPAFFRGRGFVEKIQGHATTLVAALESDRRLGNHEHRPIIFLCHGIGGIIVKQALAYSARQTSPHVGHLSSIFISTCAILFFGTPHSSRQTWDDDRRITEAIISRIKSKSQHHFSWLTDIDGLEVINAQFAPLIKKFRIFFFWEQRPTHAGGSAQFVVEQSCAAPIIDDTQHSGIDATHAGMIRFPGPESPGYRVVLSALMLYCREAPDIIAHRREAARDALARARAQEAFELMGVPLKIPDQRSLPQEPGIPKHVPNTYFDHRLQSNEQFFGRGDACGIIQNALFQPEASIGYWGVFYVDATSVEIANQSFGRIAEQGGLQHTESAGRYFLSQSPHPWLLIIDNADRKDLEVQGFFPSGNRGHILITTRNPSLRKWGNAGHIALKGLKQEEALQLLLNRAGICKPWDTSTESAGQKVIRALGYLALAVTLAADAIYERACQLTGYLDFYDYHRRKRWQRQQEVDATRDDVLIYSAFDVSLEHIQMKTTTASKDAVELLSIVSFYHFDQIPVSIFSQAIINLHKAEAAKKPDGSASWWRHAVWKRYQSSHAPLPHFLQRSLEHPEPQCIEEALSELYRVSLISYDSNQNLTFSLHPLVHTWARDRIHPNDRAEWASIALNTLAHSLLLPSDPKSGSQAEFQKAIYSHLNENLKECPITITQFEGLFGKFQLIYATVFQPSALALFQEQIAMAVKYTHLYAVTGRFKEAVYYLSMVKNVLVQVVGYNNDKTVLVMFFLSKILWGLGRLEEAISIQKHVVEYRTRVLGPESRETLQAMDHLSNCYWLHGQYSEALHLQTVTTEQMKKSLGPQDKDTLGALDTLGTILGSWHRFQESREVHQKVLDAREAAKEANVLDVLTSKCNLAMAMMGLGLAEKARGILQDVFEQRKQHLGKEHPWTLWVLCYLAKAYIKLGRLTDAEDILIEGIAAARRGLGDDHLGVLLGRGALARVYARQGRLEEAEEISLDVFERVTFSRGPLHPDCVYAMWKLGQLFELQKNLPRALSWYNAAVERSSYRLTREHPLAQMAVRRVKVISEELDIEETPSHHSNEHDGHDENDESPRTGTLQSTRTW
ncbi:hypothetical protein MW887_010729 [Aspergillus wentii]|nr:hypothetical protein MW887_010729 [Aspergillus wentii]